MCELILFNANVITLNSVLPSVELIAVRNGIIVELSGNKRMEQLASKNARIIDCRGRTVLPGFIDAHCHVRAYAENLVSVGLSPREGVDSIDEIQKRIRQCAQSRLPGTWIRGKSYNECYLAEGRHPTRWDLDTATSQHPVKLTHRSGHAHVLNSLALQQVGISAQTGDPDDGLIDRDWSTGEPTGILYGMGSFLSGKIPALNDEEINKGVALVNKKLLSCGITSVQDASSYNDLNRWKQFEAWKAQGLFKPRLTMMMGRRGFALSQCLFHSTLIDRTHLRSGGIKIIVHEVTGSLSPGQEELNEIVLAIHKAGLQVILHAVEENTIEAACNAIEYALRSFPRRDPRHRIEHCSLCPSRLVDRIRELGIVVVTQPPFIYYSGNRYLQTVPPEKHKHLYPAGKMLQQGITVGASSDSPIADPDPLIGIYSAVTRRSEKGDVVGAEESVSPMEALKMYTVYAAAANFEEKIKGSVSLGKAADLVVLSDDPLQVDTQYIKEIKVEMTILDGKVVYDRRN